MASPAGTDAYSQGSAPDRPVPGQGLRRCRPTRRRSRRTCRSTSTPRTSSPALEFLSPVKGPSLEQITVAVGTGQTLAAAGRRPVRRRRDEASQAVGTAGMVTESRPSKARAVGRRERRGARPVRPAASAAPATSGAARRAHVHPLVLRPRGRHLRRHLHRADGDVVLLRPDPVDAVRRHVHRPGQLQAVLLRAGAAQRPVAHASSTRWSPAASRSCSACCSRCS